MNNIKAKIVLAIFHIFMVSCFNSNMKFSSSSFMVFKNTKAEELAEAVECEDTVLIKSIIKKQPSLLDIQDPYYGNTLLALCIMNDKYYSFKCLLELGANVNIHNREEGSSAIIIASEYGDEGLKYVILLVDKGANVNDVENGQLYPQNKVRYSPMICACSAGSGGLQLMGFLIHSGANVDYVDEFGNSPLSSAIYSDSYLSVLSLLEAGVNVNRYVGENFETGDSLLITDVLRTYVEKIPSERYCQKRKVIDMLREKGLDYDAVKIPQVIVDRIKKMYPANWKYILTIY